MVSLERILLKTARAFFCALAYIYLIVRFRRKYTM